MTDEEINLAMADAMGWRKEDGVYMWTSNGIDRTCPVLWDWANDLNAMHEAERALTKEQFYNYFALLDTTSTCRVISTTARQRAEAFLRTLGKWDQSGEVIEMAKEVQE